MILKYFVKRHNLRKSITGFNQTPKELIKYVQNNGFTCYNDIKEVSLYGSDSSKWDAKRKLDNLIP